jgi:hypothetical protein
MFPTPTTTPRRLRSAALAFTAGAAALLALAVAAPAADATHPDQRAEYWQQRAAAYEAAYAEAATALHRIEQLTQRPHHRTAERILRTIDRARARAQAALDDCHWGSPSWGRPGRSPDARPPQPPARPEYTGPTTLSRHELDSLQNSLAAASFEAEKLQIIADAAAYAYFTVDQAAMLVQQLGFDNQRVDAATQLYPRVVDPENWHRIYASLAFTASRQELERRTRAFDDQRRSWRG